ncbi:hypothetical protein FMZ60_08600 [Alcaligenaceae bacterium SJ-26]|nr:hypothetical protein FMZ60_08600 [Alcaligenaceae bacterium SJ-26]
MQNTYRVWRISPETNLLMYPEDLPVPADGHLQVPGNCVQVEPPAIVEHRAIRWVSRVERTHHTFGHPLTGDWETLPDMRGTTLYRTDTGESYAAGSHVDIGGQSVSYPGYGDLPAWLTDQERPSPYHAWTGAAWEIDQAAQDAAQEASARAWRDAEISRVSWLRDRHRDEIDLGSETTLSAVAYEQLQTYIQALRDWPAAVGFPEDSSRPDTPDWLL